MICTATNPFVTTGTPVGHFLPVTKHIELLKTQMDDRGVLIVNGSQGKRYGAKKKWSKLKFKVNGPEVPLTVNGIKSMQDTEQEEADA